MPDIRIIAAVVALIVSFLSGWWINGNRWEADYLALKVKQEKAIAAAAEAARQFERQAREKEQDLQASADAERKRKDEKIRNLNTQLASAINSLRQRTSRSSAPVSVSCPAGNPKDSQGATGANLFREDAEFLAREAARADEIVEELMSCYRAYDKAKAALSKDK